jgi:hypothetical protein
LAQHKALPLDSPDWMPIAEAHRLLCSLTGSRALAAKDLTDAMADEDEDRRVPAMRRCFTHGIRRKADGSHERVLIGPERELLPHEYWIEHEVQSWSDATFVTLRSNTPASIKGYAYFVWEPALAKRWPAALAPTPSPPPTTDVLRPPPRRKPGPKPTDHWPEEVKAEIVRIALSDPEALRNPNFDGLNKKIRTRFGENNRWLPNDPKETEKIIREFLQRVR